MAARGPGRARPRRRARRAPPRATYRLQFHAGFTSTTPSASCRTARLGVSHVYASPIQTARPGSTHGYDIVDHGRSTPSSAARRGSARFGGAAARTASGSWSTSSPTTWASAAGQRLVARAGMGRDFAASQAFDVDGSGPAPTPARSASRSSASPTARSLEAGELPLAFEPRRAASASPLRAPLPALPLHAGASSTARRLALRAGRPTARHCSASPTGCAAWRRDARARAQSREARALAGGWDAAAALAAARARRSSARVEAFNGTPGRPGSFEGAPPAARGQAWRLATGACGRATSTTAASSTSTTSPACASRIPEVFDATHALIVQPGAGGPRPGPAHRPYRRPRRPRGLSARGLRERASAPRLLLVSRRSSSRASGCRPWPVAGTTGYDAWASSTALFVDPRPRRRWTRSTRRLAGRAAPRRAALRSQGRAARDAASPASSNVLALDLAALAERRPAHAATSSPPALRRALVDIVAAFPVYRTYLGEGEPAADDRRCVDRAVEAAKRAQRRRPDRQRARLHPAVLLDGVGRRPARPGRAAAARSGAGSSSSPVR